MNNSTVVKQAVRESIPLFTKSSASFTPGVTWSKNGFMTSTYEREQINQLPSS